MRVVEVRAGGGRRLRRRRHVAVRPGCASTQTSSIHATKTANPVNFVVALIPLASDAICVPSQKKTENAAAYVIPSWPPT